MSIITEAKFQLTRESAFVLFYSSFNLCWPPMTSEDAQTLCALWKSSKEPTPADAARICN
jgi:hypothetical protein